MKIALVFLAESEVVKVWTTPHGQSEIPTRFELPNGGQLSPIALGWTDDVYAVVPVVEFETPEGKVTVGSPSYEVVNGEVAETYTVTDYRGRVRKSIVQERLTDAGKMGEAYALLTTMPDKFGRWFAPDRPHVYSDDPDSIAFLNALDLDPDVILAPEDV
jgi:hypothetical protein